MHETAMSEQQTVLNFKKVFTNLDVNIYTIIKIIIIIFRLQTHTYYNVFKNVFIS